MAEEESSSLEGKTTYFRKKNILVLVYLPHFFDIYATLRYLWSKTVKHAF